MDEPKRVDPRLVIFDVAVTTTDEELLTRSHDKNIRDPKNKAEFKLRARVVSRWSKGESRYGNVIVELPLASQEQLLADGRIYFGWNSYRVLSSIRIPRCGARRG